jgi:DNA-binding Lrp family transcriptional regulator
MDSIDKKLLNRIQSDFPVTPQPFQVLGEELGLSEDEIIERIQSLRERKIIRRLGGVFDSKKLGYHSTLIAMHVPPEKIEETAHIVSSYDGVTHNYEREDKFNLWFTLIAESEEKIEEIIAEIRQRTGVSDILNLPAIRLYKIKVNFDL